MTVRELWLIRHGESVANVAAAKAEANGDDIISVEYRDADVPLSALGRRQARALGAELGDRRIEDEPTRVWLSPYRRAQETYEIAAVGAGIELPVRVDERLRDRELGVLDLLTRKGVRDRHPEEEARREWLGKYYHRPAGGESWVDVMLRIRTVLHDIDTVTNASRVLVAAHDAVVMLTVAVCLGWDEHELLDFAATHTVANASLTRLTRPDAGSPWTLAEFSAVGHLDADEVTIHGGDKETLEPEDANAR